MSTQALETVDQEQRNKDFLNRVREYVIKGGDFQQEDEAWVGQVKVNKDVHLRLTPKGGPTKTIKVPKEKSFTCTIRELSKLVLRAIQEGPQEMRYDFFATGSNRLADNKQCLKITILSSSVPTDYAIDKKLQGNAGIPSLDN